MQATSVAFETSCVLFNARRRVVSTLKPIFDGIVLGQQLRIGMVAQQLAGKGDYTGMTVAEVASLLNEDDLNLIHEERLQTPLFALIVKVGPTLSSSFLPTL